MTARSDGRRADQLRDVKIEIGPLKHAEGSALITMGDTRVLCSVSALPEVPAWLVGKGRGWITAEYGMLPRATSTRKPREIARGRPDGRVLEIQRLIGRSLRSVADLSALGERTLIVDCDVVQADGGTRTASVTGGFVALALACRDLGLESVLREPVAAVSAGLIDGAAVLDLHYEEDAAATVDMNFVMTASGRLVEIQGTAEGAPFVEADLLAMLRIARSGVEALAAKQRAALAD